ncbi:MAG: class I SAM-dependent methyltransferase [Deltaproteobacteria bacterium]
MIDRLYRWFHRRVSRPEERGEFSAGYWQAKVRRLADGIAAAYRGRVLEVACGEGLFLAQLLRRNKEIEAWGVDSWPDILERCRRRLHEEGLPEAHLIEADARRLPCEDIFFDAVVCINCFMCLPGFTAARAVIGEMVRVCKPGGRLIIEFRNRANALLRLKYVLAKYYDASTKNHPLSTYYEKDIVAVLRQHGCVVRRALHVDFPVKRWAPIIILEAQKNV